MQGFIVVLWVIFYFAVNAKLNVSVDANIISFTIMMAAQMVCSAIEKRGEK